MSQVFGNYNQNQRSSNWTDPPKDWLDVIGSETPATTHGLIAVRPALEVGFTEGSVKKDLLVTTAGPAGVDWNCHACIGVIDAFEFVSDKNGWTMEAGNKEILDVDTGQLPGVHLLPVGWDRYGFTFSMSSMGNGGDGADLLPVVVPVAGRLAPALIEDTNDYTDGDKIETNSVEVMPSKTIESRPEYYDVRVATRDVKKGTTSIAVYSFNTATGKYQRKANSPL